LPCVYVTDIYHYFGDLHQHINWDNHNKQGREYSYNVTLMRAFATIVAVEKRVLGLSTQHAMRIRHIVICGLPGSTIFLHISHKRHDFSKKRKVMVKEVCDFMFLKRLSEIFLILRRIK
jgi:hypothetical protein